MSEETEAVGPAPLLGFGTWTQQGPATLVVREAGWAVLVPGTRKEVIEAAWTVLGKVPAAEDLLDTMVEEAGLESADKLTAFLFAVVDGTTATVGVKGKTPLAVYTAEGAQLVAGTDEEPFVLRPVEGLRRIAFGDLPAEEPVGAPRVSSGIARVRGFVQMAVDPADLDETARAALAEQVAKDGRSIEDPEAKKRRAEKPAPAPRPSTGPSSSSPSSSSSAASKLATAGRKSGEMPPSVSRGGSSRAATPEPASDGPNMFDGLFAEAKPAAPAAPSGPATGGAASPTASEGTAPQQAGSTGEAAADGGQDQATAEPPAAASTTTAAPSAVPAAPAPQPATEAVRTERPSEAPSAPKTETPRRRLVSTSLFDRKRRGEKPEGAPSAESAASTVDGPAPAARPESTTSDGPTSATEPTATAAPEPTSTPAPDVSGAAAPQQPDSTAPAEPGSTGQDDTSSPAAEEPSAPADDAGDSGPGAGAPDSAAGAETPVPETSQASGPAAAEQPAVPATPALPAAGSPASAASPVPSASVPTPEPPEEEEFVSSDTQVAPLETESDPDTEADDGAPVTQIAPIDDGESEQDEPEEPMRTPGPRPVAAADPSPTELDNTGAYDDLFGKTVFRRIEDAAVRRAEEEDEGGEASTSDEGSEAQPDPEPMQEEPDTEDSEAPAPPEPASSSAGGDFIDWVPGVGRQAPEIAQTAARRAAEPPRPAPAYPQVHMADRPPAPQPGSPGAPASAGSADYGQVSPGRPDGQLSPNQQFYGQQPHGQHQPSEQHPGQQPYGQQQAQQPPGQQQGRRSPGGQPHGQPMTSGYAGQQVGDPGQAGPTPQHGNAQLDPASAGNRLGYPHAQQPAAPGSPSPRPGQQVGGQFPGAQSPGAGAPPPQGAAPHPVAPFGPPSHSRQPAGGDPRGSGPPATSASPATSAPSASSTGQPTGGAVTLSGLVCPNGHANSPERSACRACGAPLQGTPRTVARPPLGAIELSTGERVVLDRSAIIGRRPRASRVSVNDVPQLITVPSPQQDISRSHLELRLEGWHVVALDLGTTNGTTLYREGADPLRLRSREGVVLHDGDLLDLGDDVRLRMRERA
ncbi:FHA domain-containing protein [Brachybacterium sacelli]|uniref:FHA domain-containing protein n=1 Tax=Brachybacterium sacelli TaxID=173364 RepID=A0ABS4X6W1_9MICO|nr:FHA domain-containing protein [Brachybacterium sacelli]MBP2383469.1 hypothetical protein [Brachybacterium sacelli]